MEKKAFLFFWFFVLQLSTSYSQEWLTSFEQAKEKAAAENKPILLVFQGSDWCAPCIKLDHDIFSSEEFKEYAKEHFIMLKADFPRKKANALPKEQEQANAILFEKYNKEGIFPLVVGLDAEGRVLGQTGYKKMTPGDYINDINSIINN